MKILETSSLDTLNAEKVRALLETSFKKKLSDDYFSQSFSTVFYEPDYKAIAIFQTINNIPYLDKFAVSKEHEGAGLGKALWKQILQKFHVFVWRATPGNPFNRFYLKESHGCLKYSDWHIYWRNLDESDILPVAQVVRAKPKTLYETTL
ncbi:MAG: hypothetical protein EXS67_04890 [Candidatus Margulisbacteria bacterium]|nr:hypothetical protein [Candidatus Margulisiibacteriota bacterium]